VFFGEWPKNALVLRDPIWNHQLSPSAPFRGDPDFPDRRFFMFGFRYYKYSPSEHVLVHRNGRVVREGKGLSFYAFVRTTLIVVVPVGSADVPFMFDQTTADFQTVSIQGRVTYRVADAKRAAEQLDFTRRADGRGSITDDPQRLPQRVAEAVQSLSRSAMAMLPLQEAVTSGDVLAAKILEQLRKDDEIVLMGLSILGVAILAVKPMKETARALEAKTREEIMRQADEAGFARRNASIEQERIIRDTELEAQRAAMRKEMEIGGERLALQTREEEKRTELVALETSNAKATADGKAYELSAVMQALEGIDAERLRALSMVGMKPDALIAAAFTELAGNAGRIGTLNVTPDLLAHLTKPTGK